jgi:LmbE family N-acetylglucosaminyl deacetylase
MKSRPNSGRRKFVWLLALALAAAAGAGIWMSRHRAPPPFYAEASDWMFNENDRILVLAPHPDDEVLGCGGVAQAARRKNFPVKIVYFTYGDNNEWAFLLYRKHPVLEPKAMQAMGEMRRGEALAAGRALGISSNDQIFLGYPDFGTLTIWNAHWGSEPPHRSMLTRVTAVPYANAFRPGAPYKGEEVLRDLKQIFREFKPTQIYVSHPADHNPDHRALYLFARVALWELAPEMQPELHPYLVHFKGWPRPLNYQPTDELAPPAFFGNQIAWRSYGLVSDEVETKHRALEAHASEVKSTPALLAFVRRNEVFGDFPAIRLPRAAAGPALGERESFGTLSEGQAFLTPDEREGFVGIEERMISMENNHLVVVVRLSRPLVRATEVSIQAFGFRPDRPFGEMPKIHVRLGEWTTRVTDQSKELPPDKFVVKRNGREITVRIPLAELGGPDRILTSVHTYLGAVPLDWVAWREIDLTP